MAFDGIVLHAIQLELQAYLPAKITKIQQISDTEILFTLRSAQGTKRLLISLHSVYNRINITEQRYTTMEIPGNFVMLLRKQCDGGIIKRLKQIGLDRVLHMEIEARNELGDIHTKHMYIELMGKYANCILVDEDERIIDALKRIPPFENNKRTIHPGAVFHLPAPHLHKRDPFVNDDYQAEESFTRQFHGFSPLLSKELQYRIQNGESFADVMQEIKNSHLIYLSDVKDTTQFHCIPLQHIGGSNRSYPIMKVMDLLFKEKEEKVRIKQQSGDLFRTVQKELHKNEAKLPKLHQSLMDALNCEHYREYGDLLFAYMHSVQREKSVKVISFETGEEITIPIDMRFDIKQNANKYYQKYHKLKRAQTILQEQITLCEKEIAYFQTLHTQLEQANIQDAMEIREELTRLRYLHAQKSKIRKKKKNELPHYETYTLQDVEVYVGKNNLQNDYVTWKLGRKQHLWLHAKDLHGAHVIITSDEANEELLRDAAMLAAWYSDGRYSSSVPVNYCQVSQLKKIPGNKGSLVSLSNYKTIYIDPDPAHIQELIDQYSK